MYELLLVHNADIIITALAVPARDASIAVVLPGHSAKINIAALAVRDAYVAAVLLVHSAKILIAAAIVVHCGSPMNLDKK